MTAVFLDTVGLLALWDRSDQWHGAAESAWRTLQATRASLVTTSYVLLECGNAAARKPYRQTVNRLRESLQAAGWLIIPTDDDWTEAWEAYQRGDADDAGIVDHVSFSVMRRLRLSHSFTNDRHFAAAGFQVLF